MMDALVELTSLPNLHPALVHFPIALVPAAVLFDALSLRRRWRGMAPGATVLYVLAALGAWAATEAGESAVDSLGLLAPKTQLHLNEHSDLGRYSFWLLSAIAVVRVGLDLWDRERARRALRLLLLAVAVVAVGLVLWTADLGGGLVYGHGVAVAAAEGPGSSAAGGGVEEGGRDGNVGAGTEPATSRLVQPPGGALTWRPLASDAEAIGSVLEAAVGSDLSAVSWVDSDGGKAGLTIDVDGEAWLVLPGSHGDVQVTLELELDGFSGEVGPIHHVRSTSEAGFFLARVPEDGFVLGSLGGGETRELDRTAGGLPAGVVRLTVSAVGKHLRGLVGDTTVAHGHEPALPDGACGLLVRGTGRLRLVSLEVVPA